MRATMICAEERRALNGLPHSAQLLYIMVMRTYMDDQTGHAGGRPGALITPQICREVLYVEPHSGRSESGSPSRWAITRMIGTLIRAGLVERRQAPNFPRAMMFFLPLAWEHLTAIRAARAGQAAEAGPRTRTTSTARPAAAGMAMERPRAGASGQSETPRTRTEPARNPHGTRTEPAPQAAPQAAPEKPPQGAAPRKPALSPEAAFYQRFGAQSPAATPPDSPATPFSAPEKPAPNPHRTRTEPAPVAHAPEAAPAVALSPEGRRWLAWATNGRIQIPALSSEISSQRSIDTPPTPPEVPAVKHVDGEAIRRVQEVRARIAELPPLGRRESVAAYFGRAPHG